MKKNYLNIFFLGVIFCVFGLNSYAQTTYDWIGTSGATLATKSNWTTAANWESTTGGIITFPALDYPGHVGFTDGATVNIGVNVSCKGVGMPTINTGVTVNLASLTLGDNLIPNGSVDYVFDDKGYHIYLVVNGALTISGAFLQKHSAAGVANSGNTAPNYARPIYNYLYGTGTMTCGSFTIGDSTVPAASNVISVTGFKLGGVNAGSTLNVTVNGDFTEFSSATLTAGAVTSVCDPEFAITAGTLNIYGQIKLNDVGITYTATGNYVPLIFFSTDLYTNADSPTVNLYNATPVNVAVTTGVITQNNVDFYNIKSAGGTGVATINYAGTGAAQEVYSHTGADKIDLSPSVYQNIVFSGSGTKTVDAGTFSVSNNFTLAAGTETVDIASKNPTVTIGGNFLSNVNTILNNTAAETHALTITGTTTNGGIFNQGTSVGLTLTGAFTNSGTFNQTGSGAVTVSSASSNSGTYSQSGTALATFTGAVTNTGTINQTSTGGLTFTAAFINSGSSSLLSQTGTGTQTFSSSLTNGGTVTEGGGAVTVAGTLTNTGTLTLGSASFTMNGDYTNSGTFTAGSGTAFFSSAGTQHLNSGTGATGTTFNNVNFGNGSNKVMQSGTFSVTSTSLMTLSGSGTKVTAGGGNLVLISDANGAATIPALTNGCKVNGSSITVQRYVQAYRAYRLVSSPVYDSVGALTNYYSINYLKGSAPLTGTTGTGGGFDQGPNPTLYLYRENNAPLYTTFLNSNYRGINNILTSPTYGMDDSSYPTTTIPVGNGYLFYFRGSLHQKTLATLTVAGAAATNDTLAATGTLNQGNITVSPWYLGGTTLGFSTVSGDPTVEGANLVGNPYPSSIDWDKSDSSNAAAAIYAPHVAPFSYQLIPTGLQGSGNYNVYQAHTGGLGTRGTPNSNIIASGEGFFVFATGSGASLNFTESAKTNTENTGANLYMGKPPVAVVDQHLLLQIALDTINNDGTIIRFNSNTKPGFNPMEDARYRAGTGKVNLASLSSDNVRLAINQLPLALKGDTIKLNINTSTSGNYTLSLKSLTGVPQIYDIWLKDAFAKDSVNLRSTATYSFTINTGDTTTFSNRFKLVLVQDPALAYKLLSFAAAKTGQKQVQLTWKALNEADYTHFTVERSNDNGKTFDVIGGMLSTGAGSYALLDKAPLKGNNLYRLKTEDFNSSVTYSDVITVQFQDNGNNKDGHLSCYPNPAVSSINLTIVPKSQHVTGYNIKITNSTGMVVRYATVSDLNWQNNVSNLLTGTYLIQVTDANDHSAVGQTKFVKL